MENRTEAKKSQRAPEIGKHLRLDPAGRVWDDLSSSKKMSMA